MRFSFLILFFILILIFPVFVFSQLTREAEISIQAWVGEIPVPPPSGGVPGVIPGKIVFKGMSSPFVNVTILKNEVVAATFKALSSGRFEREITGILPGNYNFGILAQDSEGRKTVTSNFTIPVFSGMITTISGIFLSPTIEVSKKEIKKGEILDIFGQVFPQSEVKIFILPENIVFKTTPFSNGKWIFKLDTNLLKEGEHQVQAKAISFEGYQSPFSQSIPFLVLVPEKVCKGADLNFDGKVDLFDFSILLYFWEQRKPENICSDINQDGIVDLIDFSIMMYYWTG